MMPPRVGDGRKSQVHDSMTSSCCQVREPDRPGYLLSEGGGTVPPPSRSPHMPRDDRPTRLDTRTQDDTADRLAASVRPAPRAENREPAEPTLGHTNRPAPRPAPKAEGAEDVGVLSAVHQQTTPDRHPPTAPTGRAVFLPSATDSMAVIEANNAHGIRKWPGVVLAMYLRSLGHSQRAAADAAGIGMRSLSRYEQRPEVVRDALQAAGDMWHQGATGLARQAVLGRLRHETQHPSETPSTSLRYLEATDERLHAAQIERDAARTGSGTVAASGVTVHVHGGRLGFERGEVIEAGGEG